MATGWKLKQMADEQNTTPRALLIWALNSSKNYAEAGAKLGMSKGGIRAAVRRYNITVTRKNVVAS